MATEKDKMGTLTVRMLDSRKATLHESAKRIGLVRMDKTGELTGNISALLSLLAQALPDKSESEIKAFLFGDKQ